MASLLINSTVNGAYIMSASYHGEMLWYETAMSGNTTTTGGSAIRHVASTYNTATGYLYVKRDNNMNMGSHWTRFTGSYVYLASANCDCGNG